MKPLLATKVCHVLCHVAKPFLAGTVPENQHKMATSPFWRDKELFFKGLLPDHCDELFLNQL